MEVALIAPLHGPVVKYAAQELLRNYGYERQCCGVQAKLTAEVVVNWTHQHTGNGRHINWHPPKSVGFWCCMQVHMATQLH